MKIADEGGFTLVEVLIAATVLSFAVLGLAVGTVSVIRANQNTHLNAGAINLAQARVEELRAMSSAAFTALACPNFGSVGCFDSPVASGATFNRSWRITANTPVAGVSQVSVRVNWTDYTARTVTFTASVPY